MHNPSLVKICWVRLIVCLHLAIAFTLLVVSCGGKSKLHPVFLLNSEELKRAMDYGRYLLVNEVDPYDAFSGSKQELNVRISPDVILREATVAWPKNEIAFAIAQQGDNTDYAVKRTTSQALGRVQREIRFFVQLQIVKGHDPNTITYELHTNAGQNYPPLAVESPTPVREVSNFLDPGAPPTTIYNYVVHFPIRGGPGIPPIGPDVTTLDIIIKDGNQAGNVPFYLPQQWKRP